MNKQGNITKMTLVLVVFFVLAPSVASARTLKIATLAPEGTTWMKAMRKGAETIAARTDGRVRFKFYPGGVMGNDSTVMRKIRIGQLHGGALVGGELANVYPDIQIYSLPMLFRSYDEVDYVRGQVDAVLRERLETHGFVPLGLSEGGFVYLMSTKPIRATADLAGQRVWVPEGDVISATTLKKMGVSPVSLNIGDVYTGLQTGLVDTIGSSPTATIAFQWHTRLTHLTDFPLLYLVGALVVDGSVFKRLSEADQVVVREVMDEIFQGLDRLNRAENEEARGALQRQGMIFVRPDKDEVQRWNDVADDARESLKRRGAYSAELFELMMGHLKTYRGETAQGSPR